MSRLVALPGGGGMPGQLRPTVEITARRRAQSAGHPSVPLHDWAAEPDVTMLALTDAAWHALNIVSHYVRVPGAVPREKALEQVDVLADWVRQKCVGVHVDSDPTPAFGLPRPS